ncbi:glutaredoxin family protein [Undibacterium sp. Di26W]|uniref:glutaredoxin family protein n=1 Tax=Undibacterium sp. Di26W TaxID=3413035 RepID=UPI003BF22303
MLALILAGVSLQSYSSWKKTRAHRAEMSRQAATSQPVIVLYGTTWCGYCSAAREFFNANGIAYKDLDVEKSNEGYQAYKTLGVQGIPAIVIGSELIEGFDEKRVRKQLEPWLRKS